MKRVKLSVKIIGGFLFIAIITAVVDGSSSVSRISGAGAVAVVHRPSLTRGG
jgi:hypothetical protein